MSDIFKDAAAMTGATTDWSPSEMINLNNFTELTDCFRFITMATAYARAATILYKSELVESIEQQKRNNTPVLNIDSVLIPFAFLCRQVTELSIKAGILRYDPSCDLKRIGHSLERAWNHFCAIQNDDEAYKAVCAKYTVDTIRKIDRYDSRGTAFRYPQSFDDTNTDFIDPKELYLYALDFCCTFDEISRPAMKEQADNSAQNEG